MNISFGKYFDDQRDRMIQTMQHNKNTELYNAWREDYDKRQREKEEKNERKKDGKKESCRERDDGRGVATTELERT